MTTTNPCRKVFRLGNLCLCQEKSAHKIGTDSVLLGAWTGTDGMKNVLDAGTGTGILALMIAARCPRCRVTGIDVQESVVIEARRNVLTNRMEHRVQILHTALADYHPTENPDLVISNPPFFENNNAGNGRAMARSGGKTFLNQLFALASIHLSPKGRVALVWPTDRRYDLVETALTHGFTLSRELTYRDHPDAPYKRMLSEWRPLPAGNPVREELTLFRSPGRNPTPAYRRLVEHWIDL